MTPPDGILVLGAGGATGRVLVDELLAAGHRVTAAARNPAALPDFAPGRGCTGAAERLTVTRVAALPAAGVDRLLVMTSAGVSDDEGHARWYRLVASTVLREFYDDMRRLEATIRSSNLEWTFVRPARITDDRPTGSYRVGDACTPARGRRVSRVDLSRFTVAAASDAAAKEPTLLDQMGGPMGFVCSTIPVLGVADSALRRAIVDLVVSWRFLARNRLVLGATLVSAVLVAVVSSPPSTPMPAYMRGPEQ